MMPVSTRTYAALLCGLCVLFVVESMNVSTPETGGDNTTVPLTTGLSGEEAMRAVTRSPTHSPAEVAGSRMSPTEEAGKKNEVANVTTQSSRSSGGTVSVQLLHALTVTTTADGATQTSQFMTNMEGAEESNTTSLDTMTTPAASGEASSSSSSFFSSSFSSFTPVTDRSETPELSSVSSPGSELSASTQSSTSASPAAAETNNYTSEAAYTPTSTELPPATQSDTSSSISSSPSPGSSSTAVSTSSESATSASSASSSSSSSYSTSPAGIFIPVKPKKEPEPPTKPAPVTMTAVSKTTPGSGVQTCSTHSMVKHCLIIIACLALVATVFIMCTIVLCTRLSARKYRIKKRQEGTEMMCISSLLPERNYTYTRQRNHLTNGVLVLPRGEDSDEEGGDNVTLSSFFPDNDRYV